VPDGVRLPALCLLCVCLFAKRPHKTHSVLIICSAPAVPCPRRTRWDGGSRSASVRPTPYASSGSSCTNSTITTRCGALGPLHRQCACPHHGSATPHWTRPISDSALRRNDNAAVQMSDILPTSCHTSECDLLLMAWILLAGTSTSGCSSAPSRSGSLRWHRRWPSRRRNLCRPFAPWRCGPFS